MFGIMQPFAVTLMSHYKGTLLRLRYLRAVCLHHNER